MMANNNQHEDREALSALFDGELQDDAGRFALKRLTHDVNWRETCGRWQLAGDVLRGQAATPAARGFAERVTAAIVVAEAAHAAQAQVLRTAAAPAVAVSRRQWVGGAALAASVALVAMLVVRPFSQDPAAPSASTAQVAARTTPAPAPLLDDPAPTPTPSAEAPIEAPINAGGLATAAATVAVAEVPRRMAQRRSTRSQGQRVALRRQDTPVAAALNAAGAAVASASAQPAASDAAVISNPFQPQVAEVTTRPWPRAVLPAAPAAGAFTANYGNASSPSFYPFEPRLPASESVTPAGDDGPQP